MGFTGFQIFLAILLVVTGSLNTLTTKWADFLKSKGIILIINFTHYIIYPNDHVNILDSQGNVVPFNHPFVQAIAMFFGEMMCLVTFKIVYFFLKRKQVSFTSSHLSSLLSKN